MNLLPLLKKPKDAVSWLAFSCPHAPLHDKKALALIAERVRECAPDVVICLGDLHEADSASRWPSEYDWDIDHEFQTASEEVLRPIRLANPNRRAEYILLPGNHDDNILAIDRIPSKVRGRCDWRTKQFTRKGHWLNKELLTQWKVWGRYRYNKREGSYRIGATVFAHGFEASASSDESQAITLGWPQGLFVSGHTHRPTIGGPVRAMKTKTLPLDRWFLNAGMTRNFDCSYMDRKRQQMWGQALCYGWSKPISSPRFARTWDAYCELIRPFE